MSRYNGVIYDVFGQSDDGPCTGIIYHTGPGGEHTTVEAQPAVRAAHAACHAVIDGLDFGWVRERFEDRTITDLQSLARGLRHNHRVADILHDIIAEKRRARSTARAQKAASNV